MSKTATDVAALLKRVKEGDHSARNELFNILSDEEQFGRVLVAMARRILPKDHPARQIVDTRDLVQTSLKTGFHHFSQFKGQTESELLAWLRSILRSKLNRVVRRKSPVRGETKEFESRRADSRSPESEVIGKESIEILHAAISGLPLHLRVVGELRLRDFNATQIAAILGLKPATVRKRESRAVKILKETTGL